VGEPVLYLIGKKSKILCKKDRKSGLSPEEEEVESVALEEGGEERQSEKKRLEKQVTWKETRKQT